MVQWRHSANVSDTRGVIVPPALYLPVVSGAGDQQAAVVRTLVDGRRGLLAYTALDRLADKCGHEQPWVLMMTSELGRLKQQQPFDVVAFDVDVPASQRQGERLK